MKVKIEMDEKWPVFTMIHPDDHKNRRSFERCLCQDEFVEIPDEIAVEFFEIQEKYLEMQKKLEELYDHEQDREDIDFTQDDLRDNVQQNFNPFYGISPDTPASFTS